VSAVLAHSALPEATSSSSASREVAEEGETW
jgi:hypothetical protein